MKLRRARTDPHSSEGDKSRPMTAPPRGPYPSGCCFHGVGVRVRPRIRSPPDRPAPRPLRSIPGEEPHRVRKAVRNAAVMTPSPGTPGDSSLPAVRSCSPRQMASSGVSRATASQDDLIETRGPERAHSGPERAHTGKDQVSGLASLGRIAGHHGCCAEGGGRRRPPMRHSRCRNRGLPPAIRPELRAVPLVDGTSAKPETDTASRSASASALNAASAFVVIVFAPLQVEMHAEARRRGQRANRVGRRSRRRVRRSGPGGWDVRLRPRAAPRDPPRRGRALRRRGANAKPKRRIPPPVSQGLIERLPQHEGAVFDGVMIVRTSNVTAAAGAPDRSGAWPRERGKQVVVEPDAGRHVGLARPVERELDGHGRSRLSPGARSRSASSSGTVQRAGQAVKQQVVGRGIAGQRDPKRACYGGIAREPPHQNPISLSDS
jgi:hypothetical protein